MLEIIITFLNKKSILIYNNYNLTCVFRDVISGGYACGIYELF